jgi:ACS family hexuronate transporter-like MFS transporter
MSEQIQITMKDSDGFYLKNWRWFVLVTLFLATFLNYFDRQTLGTAIDPIAKEFGLDNIQRGNLLAAFIFTYAFTHLFIGFVIDRVRNVRIFFPIMLLGWSVSTMLVGLAQSYQTLLGLRYLLGFWEAVNFPICLLIIARIFPANERSLASGIFASGAFLATLAAPPVVILFSTKYDWRYSFVTAGVLGILWLIPWFTIFRKPEIRGMNWRVMELNGEQRGEFHELVSGFIHILKKPGFWAVALIGLGIVPSLYFSTQWFPSFFTQSLGHPYNQSLSLKLTMIYGMQDVGLWIGGAGVLWLSKKGIDILKSRKMVMVTAYILMVTSILLTIQTHSVTFSLILLCTYVFGIGAFLGNQHAFKQDVDPKQVATVAALVGFIETGFTAFVIKEIGVMTYGTGNFTPVFLLLAGLATFAVLVVVFMLKAKWISIK